MPAIPNLAFGDVDTMSTLVPLFDGCREFEIDRAQLLAAAEEVLASGSYILGERVRAFEEEVAHYVGGGHAVGVASGTDALVLALRASGIVPATGSSPRRSRSSRPPGPSRPPALSPCSRTSNRTR